MSAKPPVILSKYDALVERAKELIDSTRVNLLDTYWELGRMASDIEKPEFGSRNLDEFAGDVGLAKSSVYLSQQFFKCYPKKSDLERVAKRGITWTHIRTMLSAKLNESARLALEEKIEKEKLGTREFQEAVKKLVGPTGRPAVRIPDTPVAVFAKAAKLAEKLNGLWDAVTESVKALSKMKGEDAAEAREMLDELKTQMLQLRRSKL